jgi:flagellar FliL protein
MAAKADAKDTPAASAADAAPDKGAAPAAKSGAIKALLPVVLAVVAAPAASWAVAQFVLLPKLEAKLAAIQSGEITAEAAKPAKAPAKKEKSSGGHGGKEAPATTDTYEFSNVVVNLSGTMGTRYLKASFVITGVKPDTIKDAFEENKARLTDVTLGVLSSVTLADLEEPGAKNVLREKLVTAYNQALGSRVADQIYFSDFVVQ